MLLIKKVCIIINSLLTKYFIFIFIIMQLYLHLFSLPCSFCAIKILHVLNQMHGLEKSSFIKQPKISDFPKYVYKLEKTFIG